MITTLLISSGCNTQNSSVEEPAPTEVVVEEVETNESEQESETAEVVEEPVVEEPEVPANLGIRYVKRTM